MWVNKHGSYENRINAARKFQFPCIGISSWLRKSALHFIPAEAMAMQIAWIDFFRPKNKELSVIHLVTFDWQTRRHYGFQKGWKADHCAGTTSWTDHWGSRDFFLWRVHQQFPTRRHDEWFQGDSNRIGALNEQMKRLEEGALQLLLLQMEDMIAWYNLLLILTWSFFI